MKLCVRPCLTPHLCLIACLALCSAALAQNNLHDRTQFGTDISIGPNEQVSDVTCFGCSVRVRGHVSGDVTVFFGGVTIEEQGEVSGDVTNFGRGVRLERNTRVDGDVTAFGGAIRRDSDASIGGDVTNFNGSLWMLLVFGLPFVIFAAAVALIVWIVRRIVRYSAPVPA